MENEFILETVGAGQSELEIAEIADVKTSELHVGIFNTKASVLILAVSSTRKTCKLGGLARYR